MGGDCTTYFRGNISGFFCMYWKTGEKFSSWSFPTQFHSFYHWGTYSTIRHLRNDENLAWMMHELSPQESFCHWGREKLSSTDSDTREADNMRIKWAILFANTLHVMYLFNFRDPVLYMCPSHLKKRTLRQNRRHQPVSYHSVNCQSVRITYLDAPSSSCRV